MRTEAAQTYVKVGGRFMNHVVLQEGVVAVPCSAVGYLKVA